MLTILVVVTHLGFLVGGREASRLNSLFRDSNFFPDRSGRASVNGVFVDTDVLGVVVMRTGEAVYSGVVGRTKTLAVFTLSNVNSG